MIRSIFRTLPRFKGRYRLARLIFSSDIKKTKDLVIDGKHGLKYKLPNLKENIGFEIFIDGIYEEDYIQYFAKQIPANGTFLDLGANIGSICIPLSKLRPDIFIVAVEASPRVFKYLKENRELNNCKNIALENLALSSADGEQLPFYSPEEKFGKGSLSAVYTDKAEYVSTITLDTLVSKYKLNKVDYIKIDVEGYERIVFEGGKDLLSLTDAPVILFEFADWAENLGNGTRAGDAQIFLVGKGYKLYDFSNPPAVGPQTEPRAAGNFMILAAKNA